MREAGLKSHVSIQAILKKKTETKQKTNKPKPHHTPHFLPKEISYQKKHPAFQPITLFDSTCQR